MGAMEISYSNTSVWVWQLALGEQKKEGRKERMNEWRSEQAKEQKRKK